MKPYHFILWVILTFLVNLSSYAAMQTIPIVCNQEYALCTSAPCIPDPRHSNYAICACVVEKGDSVGYKACEQRAPTQDHFKVRHIVSTFSFVQFSTKKSMTCSKGTPWTNCVDSPCTIDPMDSTKAICSCPIKHDQEFFTFGGHCDTSTCVTGFWSGATTSTGASFRNVLLEKLKLPSNSWSNTACPLS
ncbi:MAG: hypothetical protein QM752_06395 [Gammaproteobacteria bacterium]